jgi:adenosylhomocysteine nucleosidase
LDAELHAFLAVLESCRTEHSGPFTFHHGVLDGTPVVITKCGVGKVLAAMTAQKIIDAFRPSRILFTGIAGALHPDLDIGDLVIGSEYVQHDLDATPLGFALGEVPHTGIRIVAASHELVAAASSFTVERGRSVTGRILSGDQFITHLEQERRAQSFAELDGTAIEMEGASLALVCHLHAVPFVVLRTISDRADHNAAVDFERFLPVASRQSLNVVRHILARCD